MSNPIFLASQDCSATDCRERRVAVRYPGNADADCQAFAASAGIYTAWVRDISATGIALLLIREFEPGALLTLQLGNAEQGVTTVVQARVVHTLEVPPDGRWLHGCSFDRPLTAAELHAFAQ